MSESFKRELIGVRYGGTLDRTTNVAHHAPDPDGRYLVNGPAQHRVYIAATTASEAARRFRRALDALQGQPLLLRRRGFDAPGIVFSTNVDPVAIAASFTMDETLAIGPQHWCAVFESNLLAGVPALSPSSALGLLCDVLLLKRRQVVMRTVTDDADTTAFLPPGVILLWVAIPLVPILSAA